MSDPGKGVSYFAFIIDVFSRKIVGWQLASHMRTTLVLDALRMALGLRQPGADFGLVAHTDAGSQYTSGDYTQELDDANVLRVDRVGRGRLRQGVGFIVHLVGMVG